MQVVKHQATATPHEMFFHLMRMRAWRILFLTFNKVSRDQGPDPIKSAYYTAVREEDGIVAFNRALGYRQSRSTSETDV